jgi:hypothetical protein
MNATAGSESAAASFPDSGPGGTGERAVPYCCPFCAEEDLRPLARGDVPGLSQAGWHCRSCLRVFSITFHGVHQPVLPGSTPVAQLPLEKS